MAEAAHICERCGSSLAGARRDARFCSSACRQAAYRERDRLLSSDNVEQVIADMSNTMPADVTDPMAALLREAVTDRQSRSRNARRG